MSKVLLIRIVPAELVFNGLRAVLRGEVVGAVMFGEVVGEVGSGG